MNKQVKGAAAFGKMAAIFEAGNDAFHKGEPETANPYPFGMSDSRRAAWRAGWLWGQSHKED